MFFCADNRSFVSILLHSFLLEFFIYLFIYLFNHFLFISESGCFFSRLFFSLFISTTNAKYCFFFLTLRSIQKAIKFFSFLKPLKPFSAHDAEGNGILKVKKIVAMFGYSYSYYLVMGHWAVLTLFSAGFFRPLGVCYRSYRTL